MHSSQHPNVFPLYFQISSSTLVGGIKWCSSPTRALRWSRTSRLTRPPGFGGNHLQCLLGEGLRKDFTLWNMSKVPVRKLWPSSSPAHPTKGLSNLQGTSAGSLSSAAICTSAFRRSRGMTGNSFCLMKNCWKNSSLLALSQTPYFYLLAAASLWSAAALCGHVVSQDGALICVKTNNYIYFFCWVYFILDQLCSLAQPVATQMFGVVEREKRCLCGKEQPGKEGQLW